MCIFSLSCWSIRICSLSKHFSKINSISMINSSTGLQEWPNTTCKVRLMLCDIASYVQMNSWSNYHEALKNIGLNKTRICDRLIAQHINCSSFKLSNYLEAGRMDTCLALILQEGKSTSHWLRPLHYELGIDVVWRNHVVPFSCIVLI